MSLLKLSHSDIVKIDKDYEKIARMVKLVYVNDAMPGIKRIKKGQGFRYVAPGKNQLSDEDLMRIKKLAIPPAWTSVWICQLENGHIQATGYDLRKRKQYRYHALWNAARSETKFHRLYEFGRALPAIRQKIERDIVADGLPREKVIATILSLMERTYIRIGNEDYEKLYGSYGVTTLKDNHVQVKGAAIKFSFKGKKHIMHNITIRNKRLARIIKQCRDIPGKELFQYYDETGDRHSVDSGMVNDYIKEAAGGDYSAKDFRTWAGTLNILRSLQSLGDAVNATESKKNIVAALNEVSMKLGNSRAICKKYYVHPDILRLYEENNLRKYLAALDNIEEPDALTGLVKDEKVLMKILKALHKGSQ
jgi:DNA topoisomerase I